MFIKFCEAENIKFVEYFVIDKWLFEQILQNVELESFLYEFLNNRKPLYDPKFVWQICEFS